MSENQNKQCFSCGTIISEEVDFCPKCGKKQRQENKKNLSTASFIIGIFSILIPFIGFIGGIISLIFGIKGTKRSKKGFAVAGIVLGFLAIIGNIILVMYIVNEIPSSRETLTSQVQESITRHYDERGIEIKFTRNLILVHRQNW